MPYNYELFNIGEYMEPPTLDEGERCWHIITGNTMDDVYAIVDPTDVDVEHKLRSALVRKYGARFNGWVLDYEDVTDFYWGDTE